MTFTNQQTITLKTNQIVPFTLGNTRIHRNTDKRKQLTVSIKEANGVLQPVLVRPTDNPEIFELIAGFGRYESCIELGFDIPALVKPMTNEEALEAQLTENLVRDDLTLVDEAKAAQKFIAQYEGDYTAAAQKLGWTKKKLGDRLELLRCCEPVLDALNKEEIQLGHAVILASFSEKLQVGTLSKILSERWTVSYLKERAGKAKMYLHTAKFDTSDCDGCPHNTSHQMGIFGLEQDTKAACAKLSCWKEKTAAWLQERKAEAEERYGTVLLFVEAGESDRNTVSAMAVGKEQYESQCVGCESNAAIMDDRPQREGVIIESQCLDKVCFSKCQSALKAVNEAPKAKDQSIVGSQAEVKNAKPAKCASITASKSKAKLPQAVTNNEREMLHVAAEPIFRTEEWFINAMMLVSICVTTGYEPKELDKSDFKAQVTACKSFTTEQVQEHIEMALKHAIAVDAKTVDKRFVMTPRDLLITVLATHPDAKAIATKAWQPSEKIFQAYTTKMIVQLCKESGFAKVYDADTKNDKKTFAKLSSQQKNDFIKGILAYDYDWSSYAPSSMFTHLK